MPPFLLPLLGTNPVSTADDVMSGRGGEWQWVGMIGFPPPTLRIASPPKVPCWFCRHRRRPFRCPSVRSSNTVRLEKFLRPSRATEQCAAATARRARGARCLLPASFLARSLPTLETMLGSGGRGEAESVGEWLYFYPLRSRSRSGCKVHRRRVHVCRGGNRFNKRVSAEVVSAFPCGPFLAKSPFFSSQRTLNTTAAPCVLSSSFFSALISRIVSGGLPHLQNENHSPPPVGPSKVSLRVAMILLLLLYGH